MRAVSPQSGQALLLAMLLALAGAVGLAYLFTSGQRVADKTRLTNAVDAAAYSAAVTQARALNFLAFTNRALVAHQVAMAHDVTLASWAKFGDTQGRRFAASNPPAPIVAAFFGAGHGRAYASAGALAGRLATQADRGSGALALAFAEHDRVVHDVLVRAQLAVQQSLAASREATIEQVLAANYTQASPPRFWLVADGLPGFVVRYGGEARQRLKRLVEESNDRYGFLAPRDHTERSHRDIDLRCPLLAHELRRRGSTALLGLDTWRSMDTQSYHALRSNRWIGCYYREYVMGHGAVKTGGGNAGEGVDYVDNPPADFSDEAFWRWVQKHTEWDLLGFVSNPFANSLALGSLSQWTGSGLPSYPEIAGAGTRQPQHLRFVLQAATSVARAEPLSQVSAVAAAEAFYARPERRTDGRTELANLFQPYWQARLVPVSDAELRLARHTRGPL